MRIDWEQSRELLIRESRRVLERFVRANPEPLAAIGYVFELWGNSHQFDLCLETAAHRTELLVAAAEADGEDLVWNSGNFACPAGLAAAEELGPEWERVSKAVHRMSNRDADAEEAYERLVEISCGALEAVVRSGVLGDWRHLQFNVSETGDDVTVVRERHAVIYERLCGTTK